MSTSTATVSWDGVRDAYVPSPDFGSRIADTVRLHVDAAEDLDHVTYEVIRHNLWMVNLEHGETMTRLSGSPSANIAQDFNPVILLEDGEELFFGPYIQHAAAACGSAVKWVLENRGENPGIADGDVFIENDPWIGCNHQIDVGIVAPVFHGEELFCWVASTLHVYDLGGSTPGSFCPDALDAFSEPAPIPPTKIVEAGVLRRDLEGS
jgi:N-methylhydantoinase B